MRDRGRDDPRSFNFQLVVFQDDRHPLKESRHNGSEVLVDDFNLVVTATVIFLATMFLIKLLAAFRHVRYCLILLTGFTKQNRD
jgi:hypothetical protein